MMTEQEWLACPYPVQLLTHLNRPRGDRKLLLYAAACCRVHWELLLYPESREALEWAEGYADGTSQRDDRAARLEWRSEGAAFRSEGAARSDELADWAESGERLSHLRGRLRTGTSLRVAAAYLANSLMSLDTTHPFDPTLRTHERCLSVSPLRDVFGNPFRPVAFSPSWRTGTVVTLARQMYDARDFGAMPTLADALQDAGCDSDDILSHCRDTSLTHVRGCWVTDLVLGKELP